MFYNPKLLEKLPLLLSEESIETAAAKLLYTTEDMLQNPPLYKIILFGNSFEYDSEAMRDKDYTLLQPLADRIINAVRLYRVATDKNGLVVYNADEEIVMCLCSDVEKVLQDDLLPLSWLPKNKYSIQGKNLNYYKRNDFLKTFEEWYFDRNIASRCETLKVKRNQISRYEETSAHTGD